MATSNSVDFSTSRDTLITAALQNIGVIDETQTPTPAQLNIGSYHLNSIIKFWQVHGYTLWNMKFGYVLPQSGYQINLGTAGGHATNVYNYTETTATSALGLFTVTVEV
jgi:hypothetical protein